MEHEHPVGTGAAEGEPGPSLSPLRVTAAQRALRQLQGGLADVDSVLARLGDAATNTEHPLHPFALALGPRFRDEGREYRLAIARLQAELADIQRQDGDETQADLRRES